MRLHQEPVSDVLHPDVWDQTYLVVELTSLDRCKVLTLGSLTMSVES